METAILGQVSSTLYLNTRQNIKRIFIALAVLAISLSIISLIEQGSIWLPLMFLLGGTVGIPMAISYPWPLMSKLLIIVGLLASLIATIYGFKNSKKLYGQVLAVLGLIAWLFIGTVFGLATGT